jgi:hypothetical protein
MQFINQLLGRAQAAPKPAPSAEGVIAVPRRAVLDKQALTAAELRPGMWVRLKDASIGILTGCSAEGVAEVTRIKPDGSTLMELGENDQAVPAIVLARAQDLKQADIEDIPEQRRPPFESLYALGYQHRSAA